MMKRKLIRTIKKILTYFIFYGLIGWIFETILYFIKTKSYVDRSILHIPFLITYGLGAVLISLVFFDDDHEIYNIAIVSSIILTIYQLILSYLIEWIFKIKYWDYSNLEFNFQGRISLLISIIYMVISVLIIKKINPLLNRIIKKYRMNKIYTICLILFGSIIIIDFILVVYQSVLH